ncbi:MAG: hypothetical protein ABI988_02495 [Nitrospirota bacterium]
MSLKLLLTLAGGLEILAGLVALIAPAHMVTMLLGVPVDAITAVVARLLGAGVFALGLACLKARDDVRSPAGLALSIGITSYKVLAAVVLLWTAAGSGIGGRCCGLRGLAKPHSALCSCWHSRSRDCKQTSTQT